MHDRTGQCSSSTTYLIHLEWICEMTCIIHAGIVDTIYSFYWYKSLCLKQKGMKVTPSRFKWHRDGPVRTLELFPPLPSLGIIKRWSKQTACYNLCLWPPFCLRLCLESPQGTADLCFHSPTDTNVYTQGGKGADLIKEQSRKIAWVLSLHATMV